jgi:uncharacterized RDD family membrane protein YckC
MNDVLLDYRLDSNIDLQLASPIKRILNWCIDTSSFIVIVSVIIFLLGLPSLLIGILTTLIGKIFIAISISIYFFVIELIMNGQSIGKYITKTQVVNNLGYRPDLSAYLLRSFFRLIPLSGISVFFAGQKTIYDNISKTIVIDTRRSKL